jgi:hypothetical protein
VACERRFGKPEYSAKPGFGALVWSKGIFIEAYTDAPQK